MAIAQHMEAEKSLVAATHQRDQAAANCAASSAIRHPSAKKSRGCAPQAEAARQRAETARARTCRSACVRAKRPKPRAAEAAETALTLRQRFPGHAGTASLRAEKRWPTMSERLASAESAEKQLARRNREGQRARDAVSEAAASGMRCAKRPASKSSCAELALQAEEMRREKITPGRTEGRARSGMGSRARRARRKWMKHCAASAHRWTSCAPTRSQRQIEKARNDADRDYLRQTCVSELNAQPEELMAQEPQLLVGEELVAAETNYNEMKARVEAMGPVNMMALEEFQECEERDRIPAPRARRPGAVDSEYAADHQRARSGFQQKFEEAFNFINAHFAIAFQSLFGGGTGEMRLGEPDSSGEAGIDIVAQPPGKRLQNILLLSGGEKALTALALLIAVFRY